MDDLPAILAMETKQGCMGYTHAVSADISMKQIKRKRCCKRSLMVYTENFQKSWKIFSVILYHSTTRELLTK